ncbi:MAG: DUF1700 domain-containing protein [Oscillospiraceae bacterium]|nr:DUF1700 domain-containing protein [Oscillospiraceae bacterium]
MTKPEFMEKLDKELARFGVVDKSEIFADFEQHFTDSAHSNISEAEICAKLGDISEIAKQYAEGEIFPVIAVETAAENHKETVQVQQEINPEYTIKDFPNDNPKDNSDNNPKVTPLPQEDNKNSYGYADEYKAQAPPPPPSGGSHADYASSGIKLNFGNFNWGNLIIVLCVDIFVFSWAIPVLFSVTLAILSIPFSFLAAGLTILIGGTFTGFWWGSFFITPFPALATVFLFIALFALGGLFMLAGVGLIKACIKALRAVINWHGTMLTGKPVFKTKNKSSKEEVNAV